MKKIDTDILRLKDIVQAITDAEAFAANGLQERKALFATAYAIAIIGEAANKLSADFRNGYPSIPWGQIIGMRHRIIHDYGQVNTARLEEAVKTHIPLLKQQLHVILAQKDQ